MYMEKNEHESPTANKQIYDAKSENVEKKSLIQTYNKEHKAAAI